MQDYSFIIILILFFLLIVALSIVSFLVYLYYSHKAQTAARIQEETIKIEGTMRHQAREQFLQWKAQEIDHVKQMQFEITRNDMTREFEQWKKDYESEIRRDAIQRSQSVTIGKITEHIVPFLPDFPFNPKDARFIGSPVDFVVFDGLNEGDVRSVVFIEVKTGESSLSTRERRVRTAIQERLVSWLEIRPSIEISKDALEDDIN